LSWILHKKNKIFLAFPILEFIWKKKKFHPPQVFVLCLLIFYFTYRSLFQDLIADNIRLRARVGVLEEAVAVLEAKLAEATATTGLWQYLLAGMGGALVLELLARPVWIRCTGRQFPLDRVLDRVVSPVVEKALAASHLAWARLLAATIYVLRRRRSETVEVGVDNLIS
jgi:hypothetical protein